MEPKTTVIYKSGTSEALGPEWHVLHVFYDHVNERGMRAANSVTLARDAGGTIMRKTDILLERWEVVSDADDLRGFKNCFDEWDKLAASKDPCKFGHSFTSHTRRLEANTMRVDDALLHKNERYDIFSDKPARASACTECPCSQWIPPAY